MRAWIPTLAAVVLLAVPAGAIDQDLWDWATTPQWGGKTNPPPPSWVRDEPSLLPMPVFPRRSLTYQELQELYWHLWRLQHNSPEPFTPNLPAAE